MILIACPKYHSPNQRTIFYDITCTRTANLQVQSPERQSLHITNVGQLGLQNWCRARAFRTNRYTTTRSKPFVIVLWRSANLVVGTYVDDGPSESSRDTVSGCTQSRDLSWELKQTWGTEESGKFPPFLPHMGGEPPFLWHAHLFQFSNFCAWKYHLRFCQTYHAYSISSVPTVNGSNETKRNRQFCFLYSYVSKC